MLMFCGGGEHANNIRVLSYFSFSLSIYCSRTDITTKLIKSTIAIIKKSPGKTGTFQISISTVYAKKGAINEATVSLLSGSSKAAVASSLRSVPVPVMSGRVVMSTFSCVTLSSPA